MKTKGTFKKQPQPGWTIEEDGFGLLTSRVVFVDDSGEATGGPKRLDAHPFDGRLQCHRVTYSVNSANRSVATADYVGIDSGTYTRIEYRADYAGGTQPIQTHPKFNTGPAYNGAAKKLSEYGWEEEAQKFPSDNTDAVSSGLVGVKSYVAGEMSVSGTFYTSAKDWLQKWVNGVGKTIKGLPGDSEVVLPTGNDPISSNHDKIGLLTNVSYERFAHLYKVSFSVRVATGGWHKYIYKVAE